MKIAPFSVALNINAYNSIHYYYTHNIIILNIYKDKDIINVTINVLPGLGGLVSTA